MTAKKLEVIQGEEAQEIQPEQVTKQVLIELVISNKATAQQKLELAKLLDEEAKAESQNEFNAKLQKVKDLMEAEGITLQQLIDSMKQPQQPIFVYVDEQKVSHEVFGAMRGKQPAWIAEMKKSVTQAKAEEFALNEAGKEWVKKIYSK